MNHETTHYIGRTDGLRMTVTIRVETHTYDRPQQTVDHHTVTETIRVSIMGGLLTRSGRDFDSCGQNIDDARNVDTTDARGWSDDDVRSLVAIWELHHLNDMNAACSHMDESTLVREPDGYGGTRIACGAVNKCPVSDYTYGHAWLVETLPTDVLAEVARLQSLPKGKLPGWLNR